MTTSLIKINLNIDKEYIPVINDIIRMLVIQIVAQMLFVLSSKSKESFFNEVFIQTVFYIIIGVISYWLIIRKLIIFQ